MTPGEGPWERGPGVVEPNPPGAEVHHAADVPDALEADANSTLPV